jgi:protease I
VAKVLMLTGDGGESLEIMYPYQRLLEAGHEVTIAAPSAKKIQTVVHDFEEGFDTYTEKRGYLVPADVAFSDVDPEDYDALLIPGGRAPEYIRNDEDVKRIVRHFFEEEEPVAAICHAPLILANAGVVEGRTMAAYPALEPDVLVAGGTFVDREAVVDGMLVTSRAWPDHPGFMREFLKMLEGVREESAVS